MFYSYETRVVSKPTVGIYICYRWSTSLRPTGRGNKESGSTSFLTKTVPIRFGNFISTFAGINDGLQEIRGSQRREAVIRIYIFYPYCMHANSVRQ